MRITNYSSFRKNMKNILDEVSHNDNIVILHRPKAPDVVCISLKEYTKLTNK